jgi:GNAT superfamily N-acetyltransferase
MYAQVAADWLADGAFTHRVQLPAGDYAAMDAWFHLTFGLEQIHGLCDLTRLDEAEQHETPRGIEIRQAREEDFPGIIDISDAIARHQAGSPSFAPMTPETPEALREGYTDFLDEEDVTAWVAMDGGTVASFQIFHPMPSDGLDLHIPPQCVELVVAATRPELRGQGISAALTQAGLRWAREAGNDWCEADWRAANIQSSRFWPRFGFEPVILRLARVIDERAAWARGDV